MNQSIDDLIGEDWDELKENSRWEAPLIYTRYIWLPIMRVFTDVIEQSRKRRATQLVIFGNTDSGKSTAMDNIIWSYIKKFQIPHHQILQIDMPTNPVSSQILKAIISSMNVGFGKNDSIGDLERQAMILLNRKKPYAIVVDESKNIGDQVDKGEQKRILQLFRNIPQMSKCPLILIGTRGILTLMGNESQTENRFNYAEFPRFQLKNGHWIYLMDFLTNLEKNIFEELNISSTLGKNYSHIGTIFKESKGKVGSIVKIYEEMVEIARLENNTKLEPQYITEAVDFLNSNRKLSDDEIDQIEADIPNKWWETKKRLTIKEIYKSYRKLYQNNIKNGKK